MSTKPDAVRAALEELERVAIGAVYHVGAANYAERKREALQWVRKAADAARAALAEQPAGVAEGWLPIETAPKGCASILCGAGGYMIGDWGIYCRHNHPKFTHWMPLPAAPKPEDTNGAA